jgi:hypothetical protein
MADEPHLEAWAELYAQSVQRAGEAIEALISAIRGDPDAD